MSQSERVGLPDIMVLEKVPFKYCPREKMNCNAYKFVPCPDCPLVTVVSRVPEVKV